MTTVLHVAGPISQLANGSFLFAALVCDVLLIRFFLMSAYVFLFAAAMLGYPKWPFVDQTGYLSIDGLAWSTVCLILHVHAFTRLLLDERRIRFRTEDQEQLWRFFYRRGGMGRLEMKQALRYGRWVRAAKGDIIVHGPEARLRFFVLVEGRTTITSMYKGQLSEARPLQSGRCFDMGLLSVFGVFNGMVKNDEHMFSAKAETDCLLYSWSIDELTIIATQLAPAVGTFFRNFTLCQLGMFLSYRLYPNQELVCATGDLEPEGVLTGEVRSRDFTDPLRGYEEQKPTLAGIWAWLRRSFDPFPPAGLRHTALPITGIMARNRLVAVKAAKAKAAIEAAEEASGWAEPLASDATADGGSLALDILTSMQTLRQLNSTSISQLLQEAASGWGLQRDESHLSGVSRLTAASQMANTLRLDTVSRRGSRQLGSSWWGRLTRGPPSHDGTKSPPLPGSKAASDGMRSPARSMPLATVDEML